MIYIFTKAEYPSLSTEVGYRLDQVKSFYKHLNEVYAGGPWYGIIFDGMKDVWFRTETDRDRAFCNFSALHDRLHQLQPSVQPSTQHTATMSDTSAVKTVMTDVKSFISDNRNTIYLVVAVLLIDHFFLNGRFTDRIKASVEKLLGKVERKVDAITSTPTA